MADLSRSFLIGRERMRFASLCDSVKVALDGSDKRRGGGEKPMDDENVKESNGRNLEE